MWGNEKFLGPVLQKHLCRHDFHRLAFPNRFLPEIAKTRAFPFNHVVDHVSFLSKRVHVFAPKQTEKRCPKKFRTEFLRCFPTPDSATTRTPTARRSSDPTTPTRTTPTTRRSSDPTTPTRTTPTTRRSSLLVLFWG